LLRNRVPIHDENGRSLGDFMMIIPGLRNKPEHLMRDIIDKIQLVCGHYGDMVVFAELNVQLNLLWISHRHRYGICPEIAAAFRKHIPEALLVGWASNI
jgi:hypothetical protein